MKTTKKGFTLIELIVVIAIIGVLAAILVPTMLGYVRKSKLSSANSTAASVYKAINSALTELDEEGIDVGGDYILDCQGGTTTWTYTTADDDDDIQSNLDKVSKKVSNFFADINKVKKGTQAAIANGSCVAVAIATDSTYTGTYPAGVVTSDNYTGYSDNTADALVDAIAVAAGAKLDNDTKDKVGQGTVPSGHAYETVAGKVE